MNQGFGGVELVLRQEVSCVQFVVLGMGQFGNRYDRSAASVLTD
jgi:hypothetical protein